MDHLSARQAVPSPSCGYFKEDMDTVHICHNLELHLNIVSSFSFPLQVPFYC